MSEDIADVLNDINNSLQEIANSLSWMKNIIISFCVWGLIFLIKDLIKWIFG